MVLQTQANALPFKEVAKSALKARRKVLSRNMVKDGSCEWSRGSDWVDY
jgi:hypothetical protein